MRTRVKTPGQNGSRERGFGSLKYEELILEEFPDALDVVAHAEDYRIEYNTVRPHEALAWNRPRDVHLGLADPLIPDFPETKICQLLDTGQAASPLPESSTALPDHPLPRHTSHQAPGPL